MDESTCTFNSFLQCTVGKWIKDDTRDYSVTLTKKLIVTIYPKAMAFVLKNTVSNLVKSRNVITPVISRAFAYRTLEIDPVSLSKGHYRCRRLIINNTLMPSGDWLKHLLLK